MLKKLLPLLLLSTTCQASVSITTDRSQLAMGEVLTLVIETDQKNPLPAPDFKSLNGDFKVLDRKKLALSNFSQGERTHTTRWTAKLSPLKSGTLHIPSFQIGGERSEVIELTISSNNKPLAKAQASVLLQALLAENEVYERSQLILNVRLQYNRTLSTATLTEPVIKGVIIESLGQVQTDQVQEGRATQASANSSYQVVEQRYALFPQKPGLFRLPSLEFKGVSIDNAGQTQTFKALSEAVEFETIPRPPEVSFDTWLPAQGLTLEYEWGASLQQLKAGDTLELKITTTATGVLSGQLPPLQWPASRGIKVYPQPPELKQFLKKGSLQAIRHQVYRLLISEPGDLRIPEMTLPWWDIRSDRPQLARIPSTTLKVAPFNPITEITPPPENNLSQSPVTQPLESAKSPPAESTEMPFMAWLWAAIALVTTLLYCISRNQHKGLQQEIEQLRNQLKHKEMVQSKEGSAQEELGVFQALTRACQQNSMPLTVERLLNWANHFWPQQNLSTLMDIEQHANDPTLTYLLRNLEYQLDGRADDEDPWQGDLLLAQIARIRKQHYKSAHTQLAPNRITPTSAF